MSTTIVAMLKVWKTPQKFFNACVKLPYVKNITFKA